MASASPVDIHMAYSARSSNGSESPVRPVEPKHVAFELRLEEAPQYRARLPLRVQIYPHDSTESIVTTVKNFYGLYSGPAGSKGVSFEDGQGNTLIARYENFKNDMTVHVRVIDSSPPPAPAYVASAYPPTALSAQSFGQSEWAQPVNQHISRPSKRL